MTFPDDVYPRWQGPWSAVSYEMSAMLPHGLLDVVDEAQSKDRVLERREQQERRQF